MPGISLCKPLSNGPLPWIPGPKPAPSSKEPASPGYKNIDSLPATSGELAESAINMPGESSREGWKEMVAKAKVSFTVVWFRVWRQESSLALCLAYLTGWLCSICSLVSQCFCIAFLQVPPNASRQNKTTKIDNHDSYERDSNTQLQAKAILRPSRDAHGLFQTPAKDEAMLDARILQTPAVIIDNGSGSCKAGITGESEPRSVLTSVVGRLTESAEEYHVGGPALFKKGALFLNYPIQRGLITSWDDMEKLWRHIYKHELKVNPSDRPVLLSEPPLNPLRNRERTTELMFEHFRVPALYLSVQATLALYASARTVGLVLDSGDGVTHCVPIYDGSCLPHGVSRLNIAGRDVSEYLASLLMQHSHCPARRPKRATVKYIKEALCYVALDPNEEMEKKAEEVLRLPDGNTVKIRFHLCQAPEILFAPKTIGVQAPGLHAMIIRSIRKCDRDICGSLYGNMVLSGGSSLFQGLDARIFKEIELHVPKGVPVRIVALPERTCAAWLGGSIITYLGSFAPMWITREDYQEFGAAVIHRKCF